MDGQTFCMPPLVVTMENMATEFQEFGFTQEPQSSIFVQLSMEIQIIAITAMLFLSTKKLSSLSNRSNVEECTVTGTMVIATILKFTSMVFERSVLSTTNQQSSITWNTMRAIHGTKLLLLLSAISSLWHMDTDIEWPINWLSTNKFLRHTPIRGFNLFRVN